MGVTIFTQELMCPITPTRLFKALFLDANTLLPKLLPQFIQSVHVLQGDGGVGTIEQINFIEDKEVRFVKHVIDEIDETKWMCKYTMIEGHPLGDKLESIGYEVKLEEVDGGCLCKMTNKYKTMGDFEIKEEEIKDGKDKTMGIYKVVEAYLLENPNVYA